MQPTRLIIALALLPLAAFAATNAALLKSEFIYERAPFPECHASTICEVNGRLVTAWFGGTREKNNDVEIWMSRHDGTNWSAPVSVANGIERGKRYPTWNPVLFQPKGEPLALFYKVGPHPESWWGVKKTSTDAGATWSAAERLPENFLGPIKNKPVQIATGEIIAGSSTEATGWRIHFERSTENGKTWERTGDIADPRNYGAIQPTILIHSNGALQALCRAEKGRIVTTWSSDAGRSWTPLTNTPLPNPNSGIDAVTLRDGLHLVLYNHTTDGRTPLNLAASRDGKTWQAALVLETVPGEFSYPAIIQTRDGLVHATYTWKRERVKHVVIDPAKLGLREMPKGKWPQ
jgi:predicted neuraminidase